MLLWMDAMNTIQNNRLTYLDIQDNCNIQMHIVYICLQRSYPCNGICHHPNMKTHWIQETCSYMRHMKDNCRIHLSKYHKVSHQCRACRYIDHWMHHKFHLGFLSNHNNKVCRNWCHSHHNNRCHPARTGPKDMRVIFSVLLVFVCLC